MNCKNIRELLTQYHLGDLDAETRAGISKHLEECEGCRAELHEIESTLDLLHEALAATSPAAPRLSDERHMEILRARGESEKERVGERENGRKGERENGGKVFELSGWMLKSHPRLRRAAAVFVVCFGLWVLSGKIMWTLSREVYCDFGAELPKSATNPLSGPVGPFLAQFKMGEVVGGDYDGEVEEIEEIEEVVFDDMAIDQQTELHYSAEPIDPIGPMTAIPDAAGDDPFSDSTPVVDFDAKGIDGPAFYTDDDDVTYSLHGGKSGASGGIVLSPKPAKYDSVATVKSPAVINGTTVIGPDKGKKEDEVYYRYLPTFKGENKRTEAEFNTETPGVDVNISYADTDGNGLVPLDIELPKQAFVGTPKNIRTDNLAKPGESPQRQNIHKPKPTAPEPTLEKAAPEEEPPQARGLSWSVGDKLVAEGGGSQAGLSLDGTEIPSEVGKPMFFEKLDRRQEAQSARRDHDEKLKLKSDYEFGWENTDRYSDEKRRERGLKDEVVFKKNLQAGTAISDVKKKRKKSMRLEDGKDLDRTIAMNELPVMGDLPGTGRLFREDLVDGRVPGVSTQPPVNDPAEPARKTKEAGESGENRGPERKPAGGKEGGRDYISREPDMPVPESVTEEASRISVSLDEVSADHYNSLIDRVKQEASNAAEKREKAAKAQAEKRALEKARKEKEAKKLEKDDSGPRFKAFGVNPFINVADNKFSTFGIDVDTASYTLARNYMANGLLPYAESVRTEEFVNFFDYGYEAPEHETFRIYAECAPSKFGRGLNMLKIGVKGKRLGREEQRKAVLTFLIDSSGSMNQPDRIGLVKKSLTMLVGKMAENDEIAVIQYDSEARVVLEHTSLKNRKDILKVIDRLQCGGSTNLEGGMKKAYEIAASGFIAGAENRVLLVSDGVANLGNVAAEDILAAVEKYRKQGIFCSVFGFGQGTYDDEMLETLANKGDGAYAFIDSEREAKRVFVDELSATLNTIARDVKIQVEFNTKTVNRYRQLGYENRQLTKEQFRDDTVDAGEVGSGQSVTALYELDLAGNQARKAKDDVLAVVRVRYRRTDNDKIEEIKLDVREKDIIKSYNEAGAGFRLATCAAEFSEILRGSPHAAGSRFEDVSEQLTPIAVELNYDHRVRELLKMVNISGSLPRAGR